MGAWIRVTSTTVSLALAVLACGSEGRDDAAGAAGGTGPGANGANGKGSESFSPTAANTTTSVDGGTTTTTPLTCNDPTNAVEGCGCRSQDAESVCWTGPANLRRVDLCREGKSTCVKTGEFLRWGPCTGQVLPGSPGIDANCQSSCKGECNPGTTRWCDEPNFCAWGKQDCLPNGKGGGSWGPCKEVPVPKGCEEVLIPGFPMPNVYDEDCCKKLGYCCQVGGVNGVNSEGNCAGITVTCQ